MTEILTIIGGAFLLISVVFGVGGLMGAMRRGERLQISNIISVGGNIGVTIWILITFVMAGWLISVLYWGLLENVYSFSEWSHIPFLLILPLILVLVALVVEVFLRVRKSRDQRR